MRTFLVIDGHFDEKKRKYPTLGFVQAKGKDEAAKKLGLEPVFDHPSDIEPCNYCHPRLRRAICLEEIREFTLPCQLAELLPDPLY